MNSRFLTGALILGASVLAVWSSFSGDDEFGRSIGITLFMAASISVFNAILMIIPVLSAAAVLVIASELFMLHWLRSVITLISLVVESVPIYIWVVAAVATLSNVPFFACSVAFSIATFPLVYAAMQSAVREITCKSFYSAAVVSGCPRRALAFEYLLPHMIRPLAAITGSLFGAALAVYGAVGAFGFANRQSLDIGTFLLRGKEMAGLDATLLLLTVSMLLIIFGSVVLALRGTRAAR